MAAAIDILACILAGAALVAALLGLAGAQKVFDRSRKHHYGTLLFYYTNLSILLAAIYFALYLVWCFTGRGSALSFVVDPTLQLSITAAVQVAMLVFFFILTDCMCHFRQSCQDLHVGVRDTILQHYVVPLLTLLFWLLVGDKRGLVWADAFLWLLLPLAYFLLIVICAKLRIPLAGKGRERWWPYRFLDMDELGFLPWLRNVALTFLGLLLLGSLLVGLGKLLTLG
ncbi:MAG: Pr6Pr family membrane protein [Coriobacteriales bacterium]|nr:Pr6Pr family membrane protein [Coriobacteriales bacterium]